MNRLAHIALLIAAATLAGCAASPTPSYDALFGVSVRQARTAMTLNPNAATSAPTLAGADGRTVHESNVRLLETFKSPPPVVNVININNSAGGR
jgi:hypothetical protein